MYRLEMHAHSRDVSHCASATAEEEIQLYQAAGYDGLVSTNHINGATYDGREEWPWEKKVAYFMAGYDALCRAAEGKIKVLLGCEINLRGSVNDYLIYGITEDWLLALGDPRGFHLKELSQRVREAGLMIFQAHPFRYGSCIMREEWLDGVEVRNGNKNHDSHDYLTALWAEKKHLIPITGSDFHNPDSLINGGILTDYPVDDNEVLLKTLREGTYRLI